MKTIAENTEKLLITAPEKWEYRLIGTFEGGQVIKAECFYLPSQSGIKIVYEAEPAPLTLALLKFWGFRRTPKKNVFTCTRFYWACHRAKQITDCVYTDQESLETANKGEIEENGCFQFWLNKFETKLAKEAL